jgi:hypothetical protein
VSRLWTVESSHSRPLPAACSPSAGKAIVKALKQRRVSARRGVDFQVMGTPGPLADGELDRAQEWGRTLRD